MSWSCLHKVPLLVSLNLNPDCFPSIAGLAAKTLAVLGSGVSSLGPAHCVTNAVYETYWLANSLPVVPYV